MSVNSTPALKTVMAPDFRSHCKTVVHSALPVFSIGKACAKVKLLGESISAFPPQMNFSQKPENGPGGTRTRICGFGRALCCHYTTGPECSFRKGRVNSKVTDHIFTLLIPKWDAAPD